MTALTLSRSVSSTTIGSSSENRTLRSDVTRTDLSTKVIMVEVHPKKTPAINGESSLDDLIAEFSQNPSFAKAFKEANAEIADLYYSDEGLTVRTLRLKAGLTQGQLAKAIESAQAHVSRIEAGSQDVYTDTVDKLAAALGVTAAEVLDAIRNTRQVAARKNQQ
jgi:ribosome-binding protein aMBF1 (putative translation factor)